MAVIDVISANLPVLRELAGKMGQLELAERVGVSRRTIARMESAQVGDPGVDLVGRVGAELGVSVALLTESELQPVELALPADVVDLLASEQAPEILDAMVRAARQGR